MKKEFLDKISKKRKQHLASIFLLVDKQIYTIINILCVTLALTFVSIEIKANPLSGLSKAAKIASKIGKVTAKGGLQTSAEMMQASARANLVNHTRRVIDFVRENTGDEKTCLFHDANINDEKYFNSLLEQLPKEDNKNSDSDETLSSNTKELKLDDEIEKNNETSKFRRTSKGIGCKWKNTHCLCSRVNKQTLVFQKNRILRNNIIEQQGLAKMSESFRQRYTEDDESDQ